MKRLVYGLAIFGGLVLVSILFMVLVGLLRQPSIADGSVLRVRFAGPLPEAKTASLPSMLSDAAQPSLHELTGAIRRAAEDPKIVGLVLDVRSPELGLAQIEEIEAAVSDFRASGKWNTAFLETAGEFSRGDGAYALATLADEVTLAPPGDVNLVGLEAQVPFLQNTLERLRIDAYVERRHEYKTAANTVTQESFTDSHAQAIKTLIDTQQQVLVSLIARNRDVEPDAVETWIEQGPHLAQSAKKLGLVDALGYWDSIREAAAAHTEREEPFVGVAEYLQTQQPTQGNDTIAFIIGSGMIVRGNSSGAPLSGQQLMASQTIADAFRAARRAEVAGVLFRISSGGGSYIASDVIRREVALTREAGIPVVVSMGDVAASGGYFVAMDANKIVAQPGTLTGSIGVYAGMFAMRDFFERWLGITFDSYQATEMADVFSSLDPPDAAAREKLAGMLDRVYEDFVTKVAKARSLPLENMDSVARGRVWSGQTAKTKGLVDRLGGMAIALDELKKLADIDLETPVSLQLFPQPKSFLQLVAESLTGQGLSLSTPLKRAATQLQRAVTRPTEQALALPPGLRPEL